MVNLFLVFTFKAYMDTVICGEIRIASFESVDI